MNGPQLARSAPTPPNATDRRPGRVQLRVVRTSRFPAVTDCTMPARKTGACPRTGCRYHLMHRRTAEHRLKAQRDCALVVANEGPHTMEEVAVILGVSREWVRQLEERALQKLKDSEGLRRVYDDGLA